MDEAHQIVLKAFENAGIVLPPGLDSLHDVTSSALVSLCRQALALIHGGTGAPAEPSPSPSPPPPPQPASERFRLCADLALSIKQLGYRGDLSFHQFLYPSEDESYKLLRFILDALSKPPTSAKKRASRKSRGNKSAGIESSETQATVKDSLSRWLEEGTQSFDAKASQNERQADDSNDLSIPFRTCTLRLAVPTASSGPGKKVPPLITRQAKPRSWLASSVLELNLKNVLTAARAHNDQLADVGKPTSDSALKTAQNVRIMSHGSLQLKANVEKPYPSCFPKFKTEHDQILHNVSEGDLEYNWKENNSEDVSWSEFAEGEEDKKHKELSELKMKLDHLLADAAEMVGEAGKLEVSSNELKNEVAVGSEDLELLEQKLILKQHAVDMALESTDSIDSIVEKLQSAIKDRHNQLTDLNTEWEAIQKPLDEKQTSLQIILESGRDQVQYKLQEMKKIRQEMKDLTIKIKKREEQVAMLSMEVENTPKGPLRNTYVRRITELIKNSKKQDSDISHIIKEIHDLQRESNTNQGRLQRTHSLVDELVFRDAKKDPLCRQAYRLLSTIHENFSDCFEKVFIIDKLSREIAELQATLEALDKSPVDLSRLQADVDAILAENEALEKLQG